MARNGDGRDVVLDLEAGLEHMSRGTPRHVDVLLAVVEPYFRSLETGRRVVDLARELGVSEVRAVVNKVRNEGDREAVREFCSTHEIRPVAWIPYDDALLDAERDGMAPIDYDPASPAMAEIQRLAAALLDRAGPW